MSSVLEINELDRRVVRAEVERSSEVTVSTSALRDLLTARDAAQKELARRVEQRHGRLEDARNACRDAMSYIDEVMTERI